MSRARDPRQRDRTRPAELIGLSAIFAVFVGGLVLLTTRQWILALEFAGATFIVALVVLAMLLLAMGPVPTKVDEDGPLDGDAEGTDGDTPRSFPH